ncbi:MAG: hypothetical protein JJ863_18805 [Deltaproteobacteria bacterium]|nr:hypothetical protein [Deltaproteobacteria bacterium]
MHRFLLVLSLAALGCGDDGGPSLEIGNLDALSNEGCGALTSSAMGVVAALDAESATDVVITDSIAYEITVEGTGFLTLRSPVDHHDWAVFVSEGTTITSTGLFFPEPKIAGACQDSGLWDYRVHVHAAEDFLLQLEGDGTVWFYAAKTPGEELDDGGMHHHDHDGGMHHHDHDGGTHHHDEDGGAHHHDEDGGAHHDHDAG